MNLIDAIRKEMGGGSACLFTPFIFTPEITAIARRLNVYSGFHTARNIFEWMLANISYIDDEKFRDSAEVFEEKIGNCAEQAFLYITIARCAGLKAGFADVSIDSHGKPVRHACSCVELERNLLVDTAYETFGINHIAYRLLDDDELSGIYSYFRKMQP
ncbi:MAG TPA: transglutaminase domain-containing protein [Nanoarchaeota archaeon]|nr:transglutaminase domain-containing protein [Nanoarchaeota archaeon]